MKDKRDECGCHRECIVLPHDCDKPCVWPQCLTPAEYDEVVRDLNENGW